MRYYFGVFGYEITKHTEFGDFILTPIVTKFSDARRLTLDEEKFNLTAIGEMRNGPNQQALFDLSGVLTFCEQRWVIVSSSYQFADEIDFAEVKKKFPAVYGTITSRKSTGALVDSDSFDPDGRVNLLGLCMQKLSDGAFEERTNFRKAFFRNVESRRLTRELVDVTYYLYFSALEILCRTILNDRNPNVAVVMCKLLNQYGFAVQQDNKTDRHLGMQTYAHLRNSLFHNGEFVASVNENGKMITLRLTDYDNYLRLLLPDLLLKIIGYNNDSINWYRWLDHMPFNGPNGTTSRLQLNFGS